MILHYTQSGFIFITAEDDPDRIVDAMLQTDYSEEFCLASDFDPDFIAGLMAAGFLVMSAQIDNDAGKEDVKGPRYILLPKLHLERSVLFFPDLHETKTVRRLLKHYELRFDGPPLLSAGPGISGGFGKDENPAPGAGLLAAHTGFDRILERCVQVHGADWLTPPLLEKLLVIRRTAAENGGGRLRGERWISPYARRRRPRRTVMPVSFGLYRNGELVAGEFGTVIGRVYTSYSGYRDEDSAGTVQLVLTGRYLRDAGYAFWDLGMPMDYKDRLGAVNVDPRRFVELYRGALS
ncbi:MAG: GNAT family N-acetyltransferase [Treponema sp.]|jgi:Leu/Phe-tRNA-protein transferase|nr:GNAT family N-acetyltransferase [Treponema sp.]